MHDDEMKCATKIGRTEPSGAVFTDYCGRGRHADGCPLGDAPSSTASTRCARCSHEFAAFAIREALEAEIAAHQEWCFAVGDWVRWEHSVMPGNWVDGELVRVLRRTIELRVGPGGDSSIGRAPGSLQELGINGRNLRRIPRPQQGEVVRAANPLEFVYDGVTLRELISLDEDANRELWAGTRQRRKATPAQQAAVSAHWSAQLRARIAARAESERLTVCVDLQDVEDLTW